MALTTIPRTAIIIPCFNDGETLGEAIQSATEQEPCEVVVVNDGSSDPSTLEVLKRLEAKGQRVLHQENRGLSAARMAGIAATQARFILPLDSDDRLVPGTVGRLADALDSRPDDSVCWGDTCTIGDREGCHRMQESLDPWLISYLNPMGYSALFRRETIKAVGGWQLRGGYEDWDLWMGIAEHGFTGFRVPGPSFLYRIHGVRFWAEAAQKHDEIYDELRKRHPGLFAARERNLELSPAPARVRTGLPLIEQSSLSRRNKRRISFALRAPRSAVSEAKGRGSFELRDRARRLTSDTLILCYHAISEDWPADLSITADAFEAQLTNFLRRGYKGVTLSASREKGGDGPEKQLVVTFDDGYASTLDRALPILERLGIPATLFVPSGQIGRGEPMAWPGIEQWLDSPYRAELTPLDWNGVRELVSRGWEIGSHTITHPHLPELSDTDLGRELKASKEKIEQELNRPCTTIAYPYGSVDDRVAAAAAETGYVLGVDLPHRWHAEEDPLRLPRIGVYQGQGGAKLAAKTSRAVRALRIATSR